MQFLPLIGSGLTVSKLLNGFILLQGNPVNVVDLQDAVLAEAKWFSRLVG